MDRLKEGYIQIYTGNGKGKTTAALGQALRAAGSGLKTFIVMFMKDFSYGEVEITTELNRWVTLKRYGNDAFVLNRQQASKKDKKPAQEALARASEAMLSAKYDIVIMDEACIAIHYGLLKIKDVLCLLKEKPKQVELIFTGRYCQSQLIEKADLVTEMQEIKHYYQNGVPARKGIEF